MGFEPTTPGITIRCSNQLSYTHQIRLPMARPAGLEPATTGLEGRCSIRLSYGRPGRIVAFEVPPWPDGRGRGIRTPDILLPKQARYQTALYPAARHAEGRLLSGPRGGLSTRAESARAAVYARLQALSMIQDQDMRSGNPALGESTFLDLGTGAVVRNDAGTMTLNGTVNKTAFLLVTLVWLYLEILRLLSKLQSRN